MKISVSIGKIFTVIFLFMCLRIDAIYSGFDFISKNHLPVLAGIFVNLNFFTEHFFSDSSLPATPKGIDPCSFSVLRT